jgi:hypothetical protein
MTEAGRPRKGPTLSRPEAARVILRDLEYATPGFETPAAETAKSGRSLHRMLSPGGNPSMDNLAIIFGALRRKLKVVGQPRGSVVSPCRQEHAQRRRIRRNSDRWSSGNRVIIVDQVVH